MLFSYRNVRLVAPSALNDQKFLTIYGGTGLLDQVVVGARLLSPEFRLIVPWLLSVFLTIHLSDFCHFWTDIISSNIN